MYELRWLAKTVPIIISGEEVYSDGVPMMTKIEVLQYRTVVIPDFIVNNDVHCDEWSEWQDVPVEEEDEK